MKREFKLTLSCKSDIIISGLCNKKTTTHTERFLRTPKNSKDFSTAV